MILGIDASNLRGGGGITHLIEFLDAAIPQKFGITKVIVWGNSQNLMQLPDKSWLIKKNPKLLNRGHLSSVAWQFFKLARLAKSEDCDVLFVPGGSWVGNFSPIVTMSRNMLPFESDEYIRYGWTLRMLKNVMLRFVQMRSFKKADGVIFLTDYAKRTVLKITGGLCGRDAIISHGLNPRFKINPKIQRTITDYTELNPYRLLYVSIVEQYKHQWSVVEAVHSLRLEGFPIEIEFVGPSYPPALKRLKSVIKKLDPDGRWAHYRGPISYKELDSVYKKADLGIFASSCENMPNILLENLASGLPVACSNRGPMPEILGDAGIYFDPENSVEIANAIRKLIQSPQLRSEKAMEGFELSKKYNWTTCADQTLEFLSSFKN